MKLFDAFRRTETKDSAAAATLVMSPGQAVWTPRDYANFAKEAYARNVVAYQCINRIGHALGAVDWTAWRGDVEVTESPLLDLLARPNPKQTTASYLMERVGYEMISGNAYQERVTVGAEPRELYNLRPDRMKVTPDASGHVRRFTYEVGGRKVIWEVDENGDADVWHSKLFNPVNDWYGQSPIEAGAYGVDQHNEAMQWVQSLLQNSARPSGALKSESELSDDQFHRLKAMIEEQYTGSGNGGRPMLLEGGLDWVGMGQSPADMQIIDTKNSAARDIALAFGVPPQMLGIPGDNTYSNYQEARLAFWEDTVIPLARRIADEWTIWLGPQFGDLRIKPDFDRVPAIAEKKQTLFDIAGSAPFLTVNEQRELVGYEPLANGDKLPTVQPVAEEMDAKTIAAVLGYK